MDRMCRLVCVFLLCVLSHLDAGQCLNPNSVHISRVEPTGEQDIVEGDRVVLQ